MERDADEGKRAGASKRLLSVTSHPKFIPPALCNEITLPHRSWLIINIVKQLGFVPVSCDMIFLIKHLHGKHCGYIAGAAACFEHSGCVMFLPVVESHAVQDHHFLEEGVDMVLVTFLHQINIQHIQFYHHYECMQKSVSWKHQMRLIKASFALSYTHLQGITMSVFCFEAYVVFV